MKLVERDKCPYCKNVNLKSLYKINYNANILRKFLIEYYNNKKIIDILKLNVYEIIECVECYGLFQKYIPDEDLSYHLYENVISTNKSFNKKKNFDHKNYKEYILDSKIIQKLFQKKNNQIKILEFGCGWGFWAKFMKGLNFNVETVEISESRAFHLKKNKIKNYKNINKINKKYDLIFSNQVLEHISNPCETIKNLSDKLNNGGFMYHKFPSMFNFKNKLSQNYIPKKDCAHPLEHINIFSEQCFEKMCKKNQLKRTDVKNLNFINQIKYQKNKFLFNQIILKK